MQRQHLFSFLFLLLACPLTARSAPIVIYDSGQTHSLSRYQVIVNPPVPVPNLTLKPAKLLFPVKTPELSSGNVATRRIHNPFLDRPFFIIGADPRSMAWLKAYAPILKKHQADGIVVNIDNALELAEIRRLAPTLDIHPVPGTQLARQLSLKHYPVLISSTRIEQ